LLARRPTPALVIAVIALFVSLGGAGYAAISVGTREIRNNSIRTQDLRDNEVRGKDVRNSSLSGRDLAFNSITGDDVRESTLGAVPNADAVGGIPAGAVARYAGALPGGTTVRGAFGARSRGFNTSELRDSVSLPLPSPVAIRNAAIRFRPGSAGRDVQEDRRCFGSASEPLAPPGLVCLYPASATPGVAGGLTGLSLDGDAGSGAARFGFMVDASANGSDSQAFSGTWAYTAP
jgi:hypothetical protein